MNDIGLKILGLIKKVKGDAVDISKIDNAYIPTIKHKEWTMLLQKYVSTDGQVNYKGFQKDSVLLNKCLTHFTKYPPGSNWTEAEKLAYWINAYNLFTIKLIVDHYPLKSIKDISNGLPMINSPWDIKFFKIGKEDFDLNTIEHEILRKQFNEPRIHFAINCASFSCPKLRNEAYIASKLNEQLEEQTAKFINNPDKNILNEKETKLSKIFDWFQSDFLKQGELLEYLKKYNASINEKNDIEYIEYNWSLNE